MTGWKLESLLDGLHQEIQLRLERSRSAIGHPVAKGDATEYIWIKLLRDYLPERYRIDKAVVIDSANQSSDQIDIVIYDRQYTPLIFTQDTTVVIPAESVYAVFEAKQSINPAHVLYAANKIASVRRLHRTSLPIPSAGGLQKPKEPGHIIGGLLTFDSDWRPPLGASLQSALINTDPIATLDIGCIAAHGLFHRDQGKLALQPTARAATAFLLELVAKLQEAATVPMIDVRAYAKYLKD